MGHPPDPGTSINVEACAPGWLAGNAVPDCIGIIDLTAANGFRPLGKEPALSVASYHSGL